MLACPILDGSGDLIGVVEIVNKNNNDFNRLDKQIVENFAVLASVAIENDRLKLLAMNGQSNIEMNKYITEPERSLVGVIPAKLMLTEEQQKIFSSRNFFSHEWKGLNHIKEIFYLYNKFGLLKEFDISNELFFRFIYKVRSSYNDVPYHNFMHVCDVLEFLCFEICSQNLQNVLSKLELLALLTSDLCHDIDHEGYNNVFNIRAETPLGILFKDTSVMETHHLTMSIDIISDENYNISFTHWMRKTQRSSGK